MLYGIIDIGSATIRLAVYLIEGDRVEMLLKRKELVGLASYVQPDGMMSREGIDQAIRVLQKFKEFLYNFNITQVDAFTTAALRNAKNSEAAVGAIEHEVGLPIRVITGDEEATYDFIGATHGIQEADGLLIDIGGGSTEVVAYRDRSIRQKVSLPIGSLAFATKYVKGVLPTTLEILDMRSEAEATIGAATDFIGIEEASITGIGGTFKGGCALYNELMGQPAVNRRMDAHRLPEVIARFLSDHGVTQEMTILLMKTVPDRLHTVLPGLMIASVLARRFKSRTITYNNAGVREGYIYSEIIGKY